MSQHLIPDPVPPRRSLSKAQRVKLFDAHKGVCVICETKIHVGQPWIDEHIDPRAISANDELGNRGPAHVKCAKAKTKKDKGDIAKCVRVRAGHLGVRKRSRFSCSRDSPFRKKVSGEVVRR